MRLKSEITLQNPFVGRGWAYSRQRDFWSGSTTLLGSPWGASINVHPHTKGWRSTPSYVLSLRLVPSVYTLSLFTFNQLVCSCHREERRESKEKPLLRRHHCTQRDATSQPRIWTVPASLLSCRSMCQFSTKTSQKPVIARAGRWINDVCVVGHGPRSVSCSLLPQDDW